MTSRFDAQPDDPMDGLISVALSQPSDDFWSQVRDRRISTTLILVAMGLFGAVLLFLAQTGATDFPYVPAQTPYIASSTLMGLGLIGTALRLISVHLERVEAADERQQLDEVQQLALQVLEDSRDFGHRPSGGR